MLILKPNLPYGTWYVSNTYSTNYKRTVDKEAVEIEVPLPGIDKEDIALEYLSEELSVNLTVESKDINQDIYLDNQVDPEAIEVTLDKGILRIRAPIKNNNRKLEIK